MKAWIRYLSQKQKIQLPVVLALMGLIVTAGALFQPENGGVEIERFSPENSISQIAPELGVTGKALARDLKLSLDVPKKTPLKDLGVEPDRLRDALEHLASHRDSGFKYFLSN